LIDFACAESAVDSSPETELEKHTEKFCCVALDIPGFGASDEPDCAWDVGRYADFVVSFVSKLRELGLIPDVEKDFVSESGNKRSTVKSARRQDRIVLAAHSNGGRIALKLATFSDIPFSVEKMILFDSAGIPPKRSLKYHIKVKTYKAGKLLLNIPVIKSIFPNAMENFAKSRGSTDYAAASPVMRAAMVKAINEDFTPLLPKVQCPTLLIWGEADTATPLSDGQLMERLIPDAGLVVVRGAGHFCFLEQPDFCERVVKSFLKI